MRPGEAALRWIRQYFLGVDPAAVPFFPPRPRRVRKPERIGVVSISPLQLLLAAVTMVSCINAIVGRVTAALAVRSLLDASVRWPR